MTFFTNSLNNMLKSLYIKDYALIDEMSVDFGPGLNILTGETGVGKSIIIGALSLLLGERSKTDVIRQGASKAVVEGIFEVARSLRWETLGDQIALDKNGLLLRREVHDSGRSRAFANDSPISNTLLSSIGDLLIDLHGQHAHQTLLNAVRHLDYLDNFGVDGALLSYVKNSYKKYRSLKTKLDSLRNKESFLREKQELLQFQVQEIGRADPKIDEEEQLELEERILRNSERLFEASKQLAELLYDGEGSVSEKLTASQDILSGLTGVDKLFEKWVKECESARIAVEEVVGSIQTYVSKVEFNPQRLEEVRERLGLLSRLKKKYGGAMERVLTFYEEARKELDRVENIESDISKAATALEDERVRLSQHCGALSELRAKTASELENRVVSALGELGLKNGVFRIHVGPKENPEGIHMGERRYAVTNRGVDSAEFFISLNPGENPKPLIQVASGGEISRIMLALKTVLAESDEIPVMVFDEIDTGISGRIASVVGKSLKDVSKKHQVICITHLPQIASKGDRHFCVEKKVTADRSRTTVRILDDEGRVHEIAKLIGGEKVSEAAIQSARELLEL